MTASAFGKPTWELHPNYRPIDMASQRRLIEGWDAGQYLSFAATPVANLALSDTDADYLHQEALCGRGWAASGRNATELNDMPDFMQGQNPTIKTKTLLANCVATLQEIAEHDRSLSEAPELTLFTTEIYLDIYADKGAESDWHQDAITGTARMRNTVKYAVALIGQSTIFSAGAFSKSDFVFDGSMLTDRHPDASLTYQPKTGAAVRFNGVAPHKAPHNTPHQTPAPRLFASVTLYNDRLPN